MKIGGEIVLLLLGLTLGKTRQVTASNEQTSCNNRQYMSEEFAKCCSRCPPGSHAVEECTESSDTQCQPCRTGTYSASWNYASNCQRCQPCVHLLVLKENCSSTKDFMCICKDGYSCDQYNAMRTRCQFCVPIVQPTTILSETTPEVSHLTQGYPPWVIAIVVVSIVLMAVTLGLVCQCCKNIIVQKYACKIKKPQAESTDLGTRSTLQQEVKVAIAEEGSDLRYPTEETDASQSAVLLPNSFSSHSNGSTQ